MWNVSSLSLPLPLSWPFQEIFQDSLILQQKKTTGMLPSSLCWHILQQIPPFHHSSVDKFHMKCHLPLSLSISVSVLTHSREDSTIPSFFSWNENSMRLYSLPPHSSLALCLSVLTHSMADSNIPSVFISRQIQWGKFHHDSAIKIPCSEFHDCFRHENSMRKKWSIHYCAGKFPWKMSSLLGSTSNSGWENIHHSSQQASSMMKIPSFPQKTNSMAKFHHFLKESKLPQRLKKHHFFSSK